MTPSRESDSAQNNPPTWLDVNRRRRSNVDGATQRGIVEQAASDRGRVVFCEHFRRLNQKTQVFALESDGVVRTRLTHSLEVAHTGMYIVDSLFIALNQEVLSEEHSDSFRQWKSLTPQQQSAIRTFVDVACLVHDIGNPPFGHFGEKAIRSWFKKRALDSKSSKDIFSSPDFTLFDGNKQGFRILTRLERNLNDEYGLNLSYTQLAATVKYPTRAQIKGSVFESEWEIKEEIWSNLKLTTTERHPLALLMEAADDIAYCISDVEDAASKGLITAEDLDEAFGPNESVLNQAHRFTMARTQITTALVKEAASKFIDRLRNATGEKINTQESLLDDNIGALSKIKSIADRRIYASRPVLSNEITGFKVITGILNALAPILDVSRPDFKSLCDSFCETTTLPTAASQLTEEPALLALFPRNIIATYLGASRLDENQDLFHRCHLLVDFVSGMTDEAALRTYRLVSGQSTYAG